VKAERWRKLKLRDLIEVKHGYAFSSEHFAASGTHVVLTPGNFFEAGGFKDKGEGEKWYSGPIPPGYVLSKGDVIVAMTEQAEGLLGSSAIVPENRRYLHNQRLGLISVRDPQAVDLTFIYYLFNSREVRQQIRASSSGVKIRHTSPTRIGEVAVSVPPIADQCRIADILRTYDDLIENNLRRMRILEETSRALFNEWFVNLRFPGHRTAIGVAKNLSVSQGWRIAKLAEVARVNRAQPTQRRRPSTFFTSTFPRWAQAQSERSRRWRSRTPLAVRAAWFSTATFCGPASDRIGGHMCWF